MTEAVPAAPAVALPGPAKRGRKATGASKFSGPSVTELLTQAVSTNKERGGVSLAALKKSLAASGYDVDKNNSRIKLGLRSLVSKGTLVQTKGTGASGSFKLNKKQAAARDKAAAKKKAPPAAAKGRKPGAAAAAAAKKKAGAKKAAKAPKRLAPAAGAKKAAKSPKKPKAAAAAKAKKTAKSPAKAKAAKPKAKPKTPKAKVAKPKKAAASKK